MPTPESEDKVVVQPILRHPAQPSSRSPDSGSRTRYVLIGAALAVLALLAVGVFVYLPKFVEQPPPPPPAATIIPKPTQPQSAPPAADVDYMKLAEQMEQAEHSRDAYNSLFSAFEKRNAAQWAGDAFTRARALGEQAATQFKAREFPASQETYKKGLEDLQQVGETAERIVKEQLTNGARAMDQGQSAAARKAFEFVLHVEADNAVATQGLKRAATLDQVFALTTAGADAERAGNLPTATERYREALKIDPEMTSAREGLNRVQGRIAADAFATAMSQAMRALSAGDPAAARAALGTAARIRPGASEIQDGLARAAEIERQQKILAHHRQAQELEQGERWKEALEQYNAALQLDPALDFALQGRARAQPRMALNNQFEELIAKPDRLLSAPVRTQAGQMLVEARKVTTPGPVLSKQIQQLSVALAQAQQPVAVVLKSDNQTQVVINRVKPLGIFSQQQLELLPGKYVVVGSRQGYRDVRKELTVLPGQPPSPLTVQCEERI